LEKKNQRSSAPHSSGKCELIFLCFATSCGVAHIACVFAQFASLMLSLCVLVSAAASVALAATTRVPLGYGVQIDPTPSSSPCVINVEVPKGSFLSLRSTKFFCCCFSPF
jgi:hypothetical protein